MEKQKYCTSCGMPIPDGQGKSCSMCYGDINYGRDGYYKEWAERQENKHIQAVLAWRITFEYNRQLAD